MPIGTSWEQARLPELLAVAERGEEVEIRTEPGALSASPFKRGHRPKARATRPGQGFPAAGSCKGMIWMADDFEAPLEEFREYME